MKLPRKFIGARIISKSGFIDTSSHRAKRARIFWRGKVWVVGEGNVDYLQGNCQEG